jgi:hypothetical protein
MAAEHGEEGAVIHRPPRFAIWKKFEIPNFDTEGNYLTRWRIIETPWASLYLHRITTPDSRPTLHDHPWNFTALVLRGGYVERRLNPRTLDVDEGRRVRRVNHMRTHAYQRRMRAQVLVEELAKFVGWRASLARWLLRQAEVRDNQQGGQA